jgi:hypothetical protein
MKYFKTFILTLLLGCQLSSVGQWQGITWPVTPNNGGDILETKIMGYDTIYTYINGAGSRISYNRGLTWNSLPNNDIRYYLNYSKLYSIKLDSLLFSSDAGNNWNFRSVGHSKFSDYYFFDDSLIVRHSRADTFIYKSSDYGASWDTIMTPNYVHPTSSVLNFEAQSFNVFKMVLVERVPPNNVRVNPFLVSTTNGGSTWDTVRIKHGSLFNGQYSFDGYHSKIYSPNDSQGYYTGEAELSRFNLSSNTWDTSSFFSPSAGVYSVPNLMSFYDNTIVLACTLTGKIDSTIAISRDNGTTWQWQDIVGASWDYEFIDNLDLFDEYYGIASSNYGTIYLYDNRLPKLGFLGPDTTVCDGYFIDLSQYSYVDSIRWSDGDTSFVRTIDTNGIYWATMYQDSDVISDTITIVINAASISIADTSFCFEGVVLADTSFTSYLWSTGATADSILIDASGTYSIEATDSNGCSANDTFSVSIYDNPMLSLPDSAQCGGTITQYAGNYSNYAWSNGGNLLLSNFNTTGIYTLTVMDSNGCIGSDTFEIVILDLPDLDIADTAQCAGSITIQSPTFSDYNWSTGSMQHTETFATSGNYSLAITDSNGCEAVDTFEIDIYTLPTVTLIDTFLCPSESVQIDARIFTSYVWSTGALTSTISTSTAGDYTVEVTDTNGCTAMDTATISSYPDVVFTLGRDTALCADSIALNVAPLKALATSYAWSTGDTSDIVVFNQSGVYWLEITDTNGCYGRDTINLTLHVAPNAPVINRVTDTLYTTSSLTHQWFKNGAVMSGQADSTLPSITVGTYQVIVVDSNGCESDTSNLVLYTAGVRDVLADGMIYTYPNPTNGGVTVRFEDISPSEIVKITVFSLQGQELDYMRHWEQDQLQLKWDIAPQPVWLVILSTSGTFKKLLIER